MTDTEQLRFPPPPPGTPSSLVHLITENFTYALCPNSVDYAIQVRRNKLGSVACIACCLLYQYNVCCVLKSKADFICSWFNVRVCLSVMFVS